MFSKRKWLLSLTMSVGLLAALVACSGPAATTTTSSPSTTTAAPPPTSTTAPATTAPSKPANAEIIMASTTSTRDSGLMDVLIPIFQKQTGYVMKPVYVGSGAAIAQGQSGNADVLLVHSPAAEVT